MEEIGTVRLTSEGAIGRLLHGYQHGELVDALEAFAVVENSAHNTLLCTPLATTFPPRTQ